MASKNPRNPVFLCDACIGTPDVFCKPRMYSHTSSGKGFETVLFVLEDVPCTHWRKDSLI